MSAFFRILALGVFAAWLAVPTGVEAGVFSFKDGIGSRWTSFARQQFRWGEQTYSIKDENGNNLEYSETSGTQGAFAQLIWVGPNGTIDAFDPNDPDGTGGDDKVVDTTYSYGSDGEVIGTYTNKFQLQTSSAVGPGQTGSNFYVRVYNNPVSGYYTQGTTASVAEATYYYQSGEYHWSYNELQGGFDNFTFAEGSDRQTLNEIQAVPEPATMGLMAVGALAMLGARRRRRG
jgi:hypothetical protein